MKDTKHSHTPRISIIAALGKNRELGKHNDLIWRISPDLKRVKELTMGHTLIMGRNTYTSIGRPLPNRTNIIVTTTYTHIGGCIVIPTFEDALTYARTIERDEIFMFGGARIYEASLPIADRLYLTLIDETEPDADVFFPAYDTQFPHITKKEDHLEHIPPFTWVTLDRV